MLALDRYFGRHTLMGYGSLTRRQFIRVGTGAMAASAGAKVTVLNPNALSAYARVVSPSDTVRFASIGTGVRGCELLQASLRVPGIECVAVCDLYDSRHEAAREAIKKGVPATRDYKEILDSGRLGDVFMIEAYSDRNTASGAWVYPIPPDANEQTIDWNAFVDGAPNRPFDPVRFFRWRCFADYGEGLAGDLFVHLISGIHFITGTNTIARRAQSTGGLFRWKDGRDFPDLIETFYDYPNFRVVLRCNLNNEGGGLLGFYGTKGTMVIKDSTLTFKPQDTRPQPESYSIHGWPAKLRDEYLKKWGEENPLPAPLDFRVDQEVETFTTPPGYDAVPDHQANFFNAVRSRKPVVENEVFGNNAAIGCHLANYAYFNKAVAVWDPGAKKIVKS